MIVYCKLAGELAAFETSSDSAEESRQLVLELLEATPPESAVLVVVK